MPAKTRFNVPAMRREFLSSDINVMAALPSMVEMKRRQEEQEAIEAEAA